MDAYVDIIIPNPLSGPSNFRLPFIGYQCLKQGNRDTLKHIVSGL